MVIALKKGETDLRPIAIGGIMRRIVHKIAMRSVARSAARYLSPLQLGVSVPGGCEAIVHSTREYLRLKRNEPDCCVLNVDIENAFNSVSRLQVLRQAIERLPVIAPLAYYCRSEEHTSELQSLMRISYAVFCLKKKKQTQKSLEML